MEVPKIIALMNENKLYGKKNGKGFYIYEGKDKKFNPEAEALRKKAGVKQESISKEDMLSRPLLIMINEAARCLEEKIVDKPDYLDMALIMGTGFPPFRGGLLQYANSLGINNVVQQLQKYQKIYGDRYAPCNLLLDMQRNNKQF